MTALVYKLSYTLFVMHFRFKATIFDMPITLSQDSIRTSAVIMPALDNIGIAV